MERRGPVIISSSHLLILPVIGRLNLLEVGRSCTLNLNRAHNLPLNSIFYGVARLFVSNSLLSTVVLTVRNSSVAGLPESLLIGAGFRSR